MAKLFGELLIGIARTYIEGRANSFLKQTAQKVMAWLDTKVHGRTARIVVGLLLGLAAYGFFPMMALLLAH
jgi:hypothetical protein